MSHYCKGASAHSSNALSFSVLILLLSMFRYGPSPAKTGDLKSAIPA
jgi:hypothetical protein